jgi:acyl-phosphate glycerol 3-phosphate acyltransferase
MTLTLFFVLLFAYALGALPVGYWLTRWRGVEPLRAAPYNIGFENALRVLGEPAVILSFGADFLKGALCVALVAGWEGNEAALLAALAGFIGHLYPPVVLFPKLYPVRGRGNVFLLGVLGGLTVFAALPFWVAALPVIVWAAVLGYWRFVSIATLAGLGMLTLIVLVSPVDALGRWAVLLLFSVATWRFKENIGRVLDKTEPRVGEVHRVAGETADQAVAAFFIHPLTLPDYFETGRFAWLEPLYRQGWISAGLLQRFGRLVRPFKIGELRGIYTSDGKEIRCHLLTAPVLPQVFKDDPEFCKLRAIQAARLAHELGASAFGLGAFWGTIGKKGLEVQAAVPEIRVTNGGAYTAGSIRAAVPEIIRHFTARGGDPKRLTAAVVGANGVVAFGMARMVAGEVGKVILIGRDLERLDKSRATLERAYPNTRFVSSLEPHDCIEADLIFTATSDPNPVIFAKDVKPGAWIYDEGRPADTDESVLSVPGVRLIPGGVVQPPGGMYDTNGWAVGRLKFGRGNVPACLAETLIIAANGAWDRVSLGETTRTENINYFVREAERLGFTVLESIDAPASVSAVPLEVARSSDGTVH